MAAFAENFSLAQAASGDVLTATGDWHGDDGVTVNACFEGGDRNAATAVLERLHRDWSEWRGRLLAEIEAQHGPVQILRVEAIHAYDGEDVAGYFEIELAAPDLFGDDLAMAVGTLSGGFEEVGVPG